MKMLGRILYVLLKNLNIKISGDAMASPLFFFARVLARKNFKKFFVSKESSSVHAK